MDNLILYNGQLVPAGDAKISVFDPGFLYGESIFTTLAVRNRLPCFLSRHLDRLLETARQTELREVPSRTALSDGVFRLLDSLGTPPALLRITLSPGPLMNFRLDSPTSGPSIWMVLPVYRTPLPPSLYRSGVVVGIGPVQSFGTTDPRFTHKTGNLFLSRWIRHHLPKDQFDALFRTPRGFFVEGTVSNLFWILKTGEILTPPETWGILPGVVRGVLLEVAHEIGIPVRWGSLTQRSVHQARGAFLTNSYIGLLPVRTLQTGRVAVAFDPLDPLLSRFSTELEHRLMQDLSHGNR